MRPVWILLVHWKTCFDNEILFFITMCYERNTCPFILESREKEIAKIKAEAIELKTK